MNDAELSQASEERRNSAPTYGPQPVDVCVFGAFHAEYAEHERRASAAHLLADQLATAVYHAAEAGLDAAFMRRLFDMTMDTHDPDDPDDDAPAWTQDFVRDDDDPPSEWAATIPGEPSNRPDLDDADGQYDDYDYRQDDDDSAGHDGYAETEGSSMSTDGNLMDRSLAFSLLLETDPEFGRLTVREGEQRVTEFVQAWRDAVHAGDQVTMGEFLGRAPKEPRRYVFLHNHYASNAVAGGHEPTCKMVTEFVNWPTMRTDASGLPECTCRVGGNTADAAIAWRRSQREADQLADHGAAVANVIAAANSMTAEQWEAGD